MSVDDFGIEVLKKAALELVPGDKSEYKLRVSVVDGITGEVNIKAPTGPFLITVTSVSSTAADPLTAALTDRVSLSIRNKSTDTTIYLGPTSSVTADDTATGGWEIGPNEDFNIDLDDSEVFYLITASGSATVKILEIAST